MIGENQMHILKRQKQTMFEAIPYIESCYELQPNDINTLKILKEVYYKKYGDASDKYQEISSKL